MKYTTKDGFVWEVVSKQAATELLHSGKEVYRVYEDESESLIEMNVQLDDDNVMFYAVEYAKKWARVDSATGKGMNQGFCVTNFEICYFENQSDLVKYLRDEMNVDEAGELSDEFILKEAYDNGDYYYTEWDVEDEDYYYIEKDGKLTEIWRDEQ